MAVYLHWDNDEQKILHYHFTDPWDWSDYEAALMEGRSWMRQKPYYVGIINNLLETDTYPAFVVTRAKRYIKSRPPNTGLVVYVSNSIFLRTAHSIIIRLLPEIAKTYTVIPTLKESRQQIHTWLEENNRAFPAKSSESE